MIVKAESEYGIKHILMNDIFGEIKNVMQFDTETKEAIIMLTDENNNVLLYTDNKPIKVKVCIPRANLVKVA